MIPSSKNNYFRISGTGETFNVDIDIIKKPFGNYYEESVLAAEEIYSLKQGPLYVLYSGGLDSEFVLNVFHSLGMNTTPVIIKFNNNYNQHDISQAIKCCEALNITPKFIDIDFDKFVTSGQMLDIAIQTCSKIYHRPATAYAASLLDGTVLLGDGEPYIRPNENTDTWNLEIDEHDFAVYNYFQIKGIYGVPHFNRYRPGMMAAYMLDPRMRDLAENKIIGKLGSNSSKHFMYNRHSPFSMPERQKYTGYEIIERSDIFKHDAFKEIEKQCAKYNGLVAIDYHKFIKEYIENV